MRVFKSKVFSKWASKENLSDEILALAIKEMENGLIDANLGGNVYKKRVAKIGQGKSGSTRTILAFKIDNKAFFIHGFSKKDKDNISDKELEYLKFYANILLNLDDDKIEIALENNELMEVIYE